MKFYAFSLEFDPLLGVYGVQVMCTENLQERKELIYAIHRDRKLSDLPKIAQVSFFHNRDIFPSF